MGGRGEVGVVDEVVEEGGFGEKEREEGSEERLTKSLGVASFLYR